MLLTIFDPPGLHRHRRSGRRGHDEDGRGAVQHLPVYLQEEGLCSQKEGDERQSRNNALQDQSFGHGN